MSAEEKALFPIDVRNINWSHMHKLFSYGIRRFYIKEDIVPLENTYYQMLSKNQIELFHDVRTAVKVKGVFKSNLSYFQSVLLPHKF